MKIGDDLVFDLTGLGCALPLALARKAPPSDGPPLPAVLTCAGCGVRYFTRPTGSSVPENGRCRACATGAAPRAAAGRGNVAAFQERSRARGGRR